MASLAVVALALGLVGCVPRPAQDPSPVVSQDAFIERFDAVCEPDALIPLSSLTTVAWDRVSIFPEGTSPEKYKAETGHQARRWAVSGKVTPADFLLVLQNDGEIVEVIQFLPGTIHWNSEKPQYSYDADVLVRMSKSDFGCYGELTPASEAN